MNFKLVIRNIKNAGMVMLAIFTLLQENAKAQSTNCVVETVFTVNIQPKPTAGFTAITSELSSTFSNSSVNAMTYSWDFGDPDSGAFNASTTANPIHNFSSPGTYTVTLTAMNGCGTRSVSQTVQATCPSISVAAAANGPTEICPGTAVTLAATPGFAGYQWLLSGNPIANGNMANFTANAPGVYTVRATDAAGCIGTSQGVSVALLPLAGPLFSTATNGLTVSFNNSSVNSTSFSWNFGDPNSGVSNTSSTTNPTHQFSAPGTYTVTLTASNSCGQQSITQIVQPGCLPISVTAAANGPTEICPGASVTLAATPGFNGYQWLLGGNPIANGNVADFTANAPGVYTVRATDAAGCIGTSQGVSVALLPLAGPLFSTATNGLTVNFNNSSVNSTSFSWNFGDPNSGTSNTSSEANPTHDFSAPGTYLVTLTAMNACGTQMITQEVVILCTPPQVSIASNDPLQFCASDSALLQATPSNLAIYQWYFNDLPIPSGTSPTHTVTDAGQYKVLVTDIFGCENFSGLLVVEVNPLPLVSISGLNLDYTEESPPVQLIGTPIGGLFSGAGLAGDQFDPSAAGVGLHTIYYTYTDANNCMNKDSVVVNVSPASATSLPAVISHIQVSPNPNHGDFWLEIVLSANRKLNFCLVNALGQTLANRQELLPSGQSMLHFSSHELSSGVYFLKVLDGEQYTCLRVMVNK